MYIHSVKLTNFKSIGDYAESEIILEPKVTAIIGKNESGKSNILDGLSRINFIKANALAFSAEVVNRNSASGTENKYIITLKPDTQETAEGICSDTLVEISKERCTITGGFFDYYLQKAWPEFETVVNFLDGINTNPMQLKDQELTSYRAYKQEFLQKESLELYRRMSALEFFHARVSKIPADHREEFGEKLGRARDAWFAISCMLPVFFYRKADKHLNTSYKLEDVEKELKGPAVAPNSLLYDFVKLIGVSAEDFVTAVRSGSLPKQETLRRRINRLVNDKINTPFHDFYQTETITLDLGFNSGVGASNCINICSILHGWGCRYIAVFDYDAAGVKTGGEYLRKDMMFEYKGQYCYLADVSQEDVDKKTYKDYPYMIEDVVTREEINRYCAETNTSSTIGKPLMAKLMSNAIESGSYQVGKECKSNFEALFNRIFSYFDK